MKTIRDLFGSKKFLAALVGLIVWIASVAGFDLDPDAVDKMLALTIVPFIIGQGIADHGKEAEKLKGGGAP
jgi:hypothetical protein